MADTGIGVPEDKHAAIFEAFTQIDASFTRLAGGTGIGLTISSKLAGLMGGRMWIESKPGEGSRFYFTAALELPKAEADDAKPSEPEPELPDHKPLHALLVEDNLVNQKVAKRLLEKDGCQVTVAANGQEALLTLERLHWSVDVVLMDVQMPVLDGLEATREIRRLEASNGKRLPIFALTAHASKHDEEQCLSAGMDRHLTKPIQLERLQNALRDVAEGKYQIGATK